MQPPPTGVASRRFTAGTDARLASWRAFLRAHARVTRQIERELQAEQGLALADYDLLAQLAASPGRRLRMGELAERLVLSRSGITRLVDRLEAGGLVERRDCETDRRGQWAAITETGRARLRGARRTHQRCVARHFLDRIPASDHARLERMLGEVAPD